MKKRINIYIDGEGGYPFEAIENVLNSFKEKLIITIDDNDNNEYHYIEVFNSNKKVTISKKSSITVCPIITPWDER